MTDTPAKPLWKKLALPLTLGAAAGFLGAYAFLWLADHDMLGRLDSSREIAGLVGIFYFLIGAMLLVGVLRPEAGARVLNVEDADELREQRQQLSYSAIAMGLLGGALVALALTGPGQALASGIGTILAAGLVLAACALSLVAQRHTDELQIALSKDATGTAFYLLFIVGGGWAMLAHTGFLGAPQPLDWLTMFAVFMIAGAFWQVGRRGMLVRGPN